MNQARLNEILVLTDFDECRDNSRNSQSVFLVVTLQEIRVIGQNVLMANPIL